nr:hypothetical protein [Tanacetum cinerariifolium]
MKKKGARTHKESQICCGQFISKLARKCRVLTQDVDPQLGVPRVDIPRPLKASMQDLYDRMDRMEIRQEAIEHMEEPTTRLAMISHGVNTPRCDEDRLDLIELMVFLLPSDEKVRIEVSAVDLQTFVAVKKVNDVTRLQALVDKKKVVITEASIKDALHLDDAEGVECLPNEEIFTELARIGFEKPSTMLTFYKAFFSSQWKFLIHTVLKQVGDLSSHSTKCTSPALTQKVFANMRRICKGFSRVNTPLFEGMLVAQEVGEDADEVHAKDVNAARVVAEDAASDDVNAAVDEPSIPSPPPPTPPPQPSQDIPSTSQEEDSEQAELQEVVDVVTTAKIITEVVTAASDTITVATTTITIVDVPISTAIIITASILTVAPSRRKKGVVIKDPQETATPSTIIHSEAKSKDKGKGILDEVIDHMKRKQKEDNAVKRYQALKRKPQTEAQVRKNMMIYLRNVAGFKMDYFKGMTYDNIRPIFEKHFDSNVAFLQKTKEQMDKEDGRALKRLNETQEEKAAKKQKLDEEVEELKRHLQIVPNDEDDAYTKATLLARKVPVVDYEIYNENNKPYYKIKRADGSYQLYLSFLSLLRNFDREDLDAL